MFLDPVVPCFSAIADPLMRPRENVMNAKMIIKKIKRKHNKIKGIKGTA